MKTKYEIVRRNDSIGSLVQPELYDNKEAAEAEMLKLAKKVRDDTNRIMDTEIYSICVMDGPVVSILKADVEVESWYLQKSKTP